MNTTIDIITATALCVAAVAFATTAIVLFRQSMQYRRNDAVLAMKRLEILDLRAALLQCVDVLESADCSEGYCCCGDLEINHGMGTGHAYVDEGTSRQRLALDAARDVLSRCAPVRPRT